jgi:hypothetical protein
MIDALDRYLHLEVRVPNGTELWWDSFQAASRSQYVLTLVAKSLMAMPASEASCERLISLFESLFDETRMGAHIELN